MGRRGSGVRAVAAHVVWFCCAVTALLLAAAALLVGLRVDEESAAGLPVRWARAVDLPYVSDGGGLGGGLLVDPVHQVVAAWALAAVVWLFVGAVLVRVLRPRN